MAAKSVIVRLQSTESPYFKMTRKNPRMLGGHNNTGKLRLRKYDPILRKHVDFEEKKVSK